MSQLSFFSAESVPPAVTDLTGVLAAAGQAVMVGGGARLSVVVDTTKGKVVSTKLVPVGKGWALSIKVGPTTTVVAIAPNGAMSVG